MDIQDIDPTKLGFDLEVKDLTREIVITVNAHDDETFKFLADAAAEIQVAWNKELEDWKKERAKNQP